MTMHEHLPDSSEDQSPELRDQSPTDPRQHCNACQVYAIEVLVLGRDRSPVSGICVRLSKSPGQCSEESTGPDGLARFDGLVAGAYSVEFPDLDKEAWKYLREQGIEARALESSGRIQWYAPRAAEAPLPPHEIVPGDCLSNLAFRWGFAPETIWNFGGNADLKKSRSSMHILAPGDLVVVPPKRTAAFPASTSMRYIVELVSVPEILQVRFVTPGYDPRAGEPYLLQIQTEDGAVIEDRKGTTDGDGFLREPIPPNATQGEIWLGKGLDIEKHRIRLGHIDPIDTVRGIQARLNNLGHLCGEEDGLFNDLTREALRAFQLRVQLPVTGEPDAATTAMLEELHRS